eukprot:CAMPEP_0168213334 /NCGR_PEP_ID=MMETSP0140_2-20121125/4742_1 /TAXON_ID=44445 /ORGANISM="Pseudo-nitzschia australis, Strain 10249 10 AB" /LENGTH=455 /DNA_ID=CAMNT_0008140183 /DNA_START=266 /DNA_END=1634 /DNA_ORIENTATION=-
MRLCSKNHRRPKTAASACNNNNNGSLFLALAVGKGFVVLTHALLLIVLSGELPCATPFSMGRSRIGTSGSYSNDDNFPTAVTENSASLLRVHRHPPNGSSSSTDPLSRLEASINNNNARVGTTEDEISSSSRDNDIDELLSTRATNPASKTENDGDELSSSPSSPLSDSFSSFSSRETPILAELLLLDDNKPDTPNGGSSLFPPIESFPAKTTTTTTISNIASSPWWRSERSSEILVAGLAVGAFSNILGDLLANYEWVQTLRYFWPLSLGLYYGLLWNHASTHDSNPLDAEEQRKAFYEEFGPDAANSGIYSNTNTNTNIAVVCGGVGGRPAPGVDDGPNLLTHAGLAPDCAVLLLAMSMGENYFSGSSNMSSNNIDDNDDESKNSDQKEVTNAPLMSSSTRATNSSSSNSTTIIGSMPLLLKIALWAELYTLGGSSVDEVFTAVQTALSSVAS